MDFSASVLKASNESGNAMRLVRLTGDPLSAYALTASNGAWDGGGRIPPEMVSVLFRALSGSEGEGVKWESDKFRGDSVEPGFKAAEPAPGNPGPHYPARAELGRAAGEVVTQFTIGPDGRARPESLLIMRSTHPLFSLAVREALPSMRFLPATRLGIPVETSVIQQFQFKLP
jgi:TonB family protein